MYDIKDVYASFRKTQSKYISRPYVIPKDFDQFYNDNMIEKNRKYLDLITKNFNTKWRHIDVDRYFSCGFELFGKNFTYVKFLDRRIIKFYIERDKSLKRSMALTKEEINKSFTFIKRYSNKRGFRNTSKLSILSQYCHSKEDNQTTPVRHYIKGKISKYVIVWLCNTGFMVLADEDRILLPLIVEKWREYVEELKSVDIKNLAVKQGLL
ncbi:MAG: hypothetical protein ACOC5T_05140 [Elusimicrobiota bacterium]